MIKRPIFLGVMISIVRLTSVWAAGPQPVDKVLDAYVKATGGQAAVNRIASREIEARHHGGKIKYYWQKPDSVLLVDGKKRTAWDGASGWTISTKKRVSKLSKGSQRPLQMDANPLRYVYLRQLYPEIDAAAPEALDGKQTDVLLAPNGRGSTKFYFDRESHLLARIEETGETSAYFKHVADFSEYRDADGVQFPFRIVHTSTEPDAKTDDVRISKVMQNVEIEPGLFAKPPVVR